MNGNNRFARTSLWLVAGIFVLATSGTVWAQSSSSPKRTKVEPWLEAPGATALAKGAGAEDRAVGRVNVSQFDQRTHNFGDMGTTAEGWHCCRYPRPDGSGSLDSYGWNQSMALAVGPGSWLSTPQVHESTGDFQSLSLADWESQDGARGAQFSNPPQTWSGYPMFATSDLPGTWPPAGWPAPETVTDIWIGTDEWNKWERRADKEIYCEFDDTGVRFTRRCLLPVRADQQQQQHLHRVLHRPVRRPGFTHIQQLDRIPARRFHALYDLQHR